MSAEHPETYQTKKERMQEAYIQGYLQGYGVEEPTDINKKKARRMFNSWFEVNYE